MGAAGSGKEGARARQLKCVVRSLGEERKEGAPREGTRHSKARVPGAKGGTKNIQHRMAAEAAGAHKSTPERVKNEEGKRTGQASPMRRQCDIKATSKRVDSQGMGTPKPPRDECRMQNEECSQIQARRRPPGSQELGIWSLVFLLCCSCAPLVLLWFPSGSPVVVSAAPRRLRRGPSWYRLSWSVGYSHAIGFFDKSPAVCRSLSKPLQRHAGAKEEGRMQNDEWAEKTTRSQDRAPLPTLTPECGGIGWRR